MLLLTSTSDLVRVVTDASADIEVHASWVDNASGTITPGRTNTASITTATTTTVVVSPSASTQRNVKHLNIRNNHASTSTLMTVFHTDGTNQEDLYECTLLAGETVTFDQMGRWTHFDANGGQYPAGLVATQADQESGASLTALVTPGRQHFHPSACKAWVKSTPGNVVAVSYNITSVTDSNTGRAVVTIATDISTSNYAAVLSTERASTTLSLAELRFSVIRSATQAAGSYEHEVMDGQATPTAKDPAAWHSAIFGDFA